VLWPLGKLDGRDKHMFVIPVVIPKTLSDVQAVDDNNNVYNMTGTVNPGGKVTMFNFVGGMPGLKIKDYGKPTAEIFFNEVGIIQGQPVLPTLVQMAQVVRETLDRLSDYVIAAGWKRARA
jgi:hypothetical protein